MTNRWYAALGDDGLKPVVWGVGEGEEAAREDARLALEAGDARDDPNDLNLVAISNELAVRIQNGEVDAAALGLV